MGFFKNLLKIFTREKIDWEELEVALIKTDMGIQTVIAMIDELKKRKDISPDDVVGSVKEHMKGILAHEPISLVPFPDRPKVIMMTGINGTGKTTSTAKLAWYLKNKGHSVMLAAADTFRAAAIEQLDHWANRIGIPIIKAAYQSDPSSVCFDAMQAATAQKADFLIIDTAGRLHTRHNLMEELKKMVRTIGKKDPSAPHETFLVVDASTGNNALNQAREFHKAIPLTGLIVTKIDGSGKGGIMVPIKKELGIPPLFIGLGESLGDFEPFDSETFVEKLF